MSLTLAIVGRPNVGKSTLYNRLTGTRRALVHDMPGVTRDRREGEGRIGSLTFNLYDTAGLEEASEGSLSARMTEQSLLAVQDADVALLVIDGRVGVTPQDRYFAQSLRKLGKPMILVINKCEGNRGLDWLSEAYSLGLGEPVPVSAEHGDGMADLFQAIMAVQPQEEEEEDAIEDEDAELDETSPPTIAVIGRPNAGKSTLINTILKRERLLTGPEAGITRDAITVEHHFKGRTIKLVDTAGMRRRANVVEDLEKMAVGDTLHALRFAHVAIVVMDGEMPLEKQDNMIAALAEKEGRAVVIALNKWDAVQEKQEVLKAFHARLEHVLPQLKGVSAIPLSAREGTHIGKLLDAAMHTYQLWNKRISTGELNRWLEAALERNTPPLIDGRRLKIRYITQSKARPPTFALFANRSDIPDHYLRYLTNSLRESFDLPGVPIRMNIRKRKNPYAE